MTLVIFEESQGCVISGILSLALPRCMKPPPVTFFFFFKCTIRFSKGADPDSDPTGIWLPRIIQPAIKHTVRSLRPTTHVSTIYLGFHHNDAISSEGD